VEIPETIALRWLTDKREYCGSWIGGRRDQFEAFAEEGGTPTLELKLLELDMEVRGDLFGEGMKECTRQLKVTVSVALEETTG